MKHLYYYVARLLALRLHGMPSLQPDTGHAACAPRQFSANRSSADNYYSLNLLLA